MFGHFTTLCMKGLTFKMPGLLGIKVQDNESK